MQVKKFRLNDKVLIKIGHPIIEISKGESKIIDSDEDLVGKTAKIIQCAEHGYMLYCDDIDDRLAWFDDTQLELLERFYAEI
jgi:hypothetical protein